MRIRPLLSWWRYMMTPSNGNIFRVTGHLCGEFTGSGEFPAQRPVTRSFDVFFDLRLNKRLSKHSWGWWFETPWHPLRRHGNEESIHQQLSVNSLWSSDAIWCDRTVSTLVQVTAFCMTPKCHYLNQCWLFTYEVLWHSHESNFIGNVHDIYHSCEFWKLLIEAYNHISEKPKSWI